jgi:hypothetical protein
LQAFGVNFDQDDPDSTGNDDDCIRDKPSDYGGSDVDMGDLKGYINVGKVPTTGDGPRGTGRIITFPNWVQVRVTFLGGDVSSVMPKLDVSASRCPRREHFDGPSRDSEDRS